MFASSDAYGVLLPFAAKSLKSPCTSVALGPTDVKERLCLGVDFHSGPKVDLTRRPNPSGESVGRVARLSRNVRQPNQILRDEIAGHQVQRRPGTGEIWLAATQHDGAKVESILID